MHHTAHTYLFTNRFSYVGMDSTEERETIATDLESFFIKAPGKILN
jgi:hypothetical protein